MTDASYLRAISTKQSSATYPSMTIDMVMMTLHAIAFG
jgi:hypothetical protein